jgi:ABC-type branched-subunit amino acid transport system ATPase component
MKRRETGGNGGTARIPRVFEIGRIALSGNRGELLEDERIKKAYLGAQ